MKWLHSLLGEDATQPTAAASDAVATASIGDKSADQPLAPGSGPESAVVSAGPVVAVPTGADDVVVRAELGGPTPSSDTSIDDLSTVIEAPGREFSVVKLVLAELTAGLGGVSEQQRQLNELFASRLRSDDAQARAVEILHDELRQYKSGFVRQQVLPLLKEVIFCHDFATNEIARLGGASQAGDSGAPVRPLEVIRQMLLDLLFKYDVEPFRSEGDVFDPKSQQCTQMLAADHNDLDKRIAARGLEGFRGPEGIVRREQVNVYKFSPGAS
ncbi:MAG: hypothetical protein ACT4QC_23560 [Planctomycetaceae bacterium]